MINQSVVYHRLRRGYKGLKTRHLISRSSYTDLCIEGYPRSSNSFSVRMFKQSNDVLIAHHLHCTGNIARAIRADIPTLVLIRDPEQAIASYLSSKSQVVPPTPYQCRYALSYYLWFYQWTLRHNHKICYADFSVTTSDFNQVIHALNRQFGTEFNLISDLTAAQNNVKATLSSLKSKHKNLSPSKSNFYALPDADRSMQKEQVLPLIRQHPLLSSCKDVFSKIQLRINNQP
jgi:hypothetical protein